MKIRTHDSWIIRPAAAVIRNACSKTRRSTRRCGWTCDSFVRAIAERRFSQQPANTDTTTSSIPRPPPPLLRRPSLPLTQNEHQKVCEVNYTN
ncbi:Hypothetical predicted protein [Octopus vulgaris]|uniref:Uncharacterized protein n=1 Tax=Octopus vulgaris TaxID=6645 RepID=A0AA36BUJ3_OCTVU|nr:Hypothetical predicted protein [Octopus vulgaris]